MRRASRRSDAGRRHGERGWSSNVRSGGMETFVGLLTFYISWAGGNLSPQRRRTLERAKDKLRDLFGARR